MTEDERQEILNDIKDGYIDAWDNLTIDKLFKQIEKEHEEIQQYRAIGTVEGYELAIQSSIENYNLYREYKAKVQDFEAIGTIEEFKALKEKQYDCTIKHLTNECSYKETGCSDCKGYWKIRKLLEKNVAKKSKEVHENEICIDFICPNCKEAVYGQPYRPNYCKHCGQKLDWEWKEKNMADEVKENNKQLVCEIKIDAEMMRKIIDEKMTQIELDVQKIRAKAIDEFVKLADECSGYTANCIEHDLALTIYTIHQIAEQLKAGVENG